MVPGAKDIKVLCTENEEECVSWFAGIRLAKHGHALYDDYYKAHLKQFKLEGAEDGQTANIQQTVEERAYTLSGMRLEKHLDKKREVYQKEKEAREVQENLIRHNTWDPSVQREEPPAEVLPKAPPKVLPKPQRGPSQEEPPPPQQPPPPEPRLDDLTKYPWYHGAIPREEAVRRLEQMGGKDG